MKGLVWGVVFLFDHFMVVSSTADAIVDVDCFGTVAGNWWWWSAGQVRWLVEGEVRGVRRI